MSNDVTSLISGAIVVIGQIVTHIVSQKKTKVVAEKVTSEATGKASEYADKIVRRLNEQAQQVDVLSERVKSLSIAFSSLDSSVKNTQFSINNLASNVDKQGRLVVEMAKAYKLSDKTVVKGVK